MNAIPPMRADQPVTITLPAARWNEVIEGLTFLPYRLAAPLISVIHEQVQRAPLEAAIRETDAARASTASDPPEGASAPAPPTDAG